MRCLDAPRRPLRAAELPDPEPSSGQVRIRVQACGVCRTDLHVVDGELHHPKLPLVPGHEIVGTRRRARRRASSASASATASACRGSAGPAARAATAAPAGRTSVRHARFTGYQIDGGYAEYTVADAALLLPAARPVSRRRGRAAAVRRPDRLPLAAHGRRGASASASTASAPPRTSSRRSRATRAARSTPSRGPGDAAGAGIRPSSWAPSGPATRTTAPPEALDAAIIFAPVGALVPAALRAVAKGGTVVCAGIHMSDIPAFPYDILWESASIRSVANLTRARRRGVPRAGAAGAGADVGDALPARTRQRRIGRSARWQAARRGGSYSILGHSETSDIGQ